MKPPSEHILEKRWLIPITNICNLSCGGCAQLCGHFPKDKLWHLSLEEIDKYINALKPYTSEEADWNEVTIFGGEPTVHPQWDEVLEILYSHEPMRFRVNTNGRLGHSPFEIQKNIRYHVDLHPANQEFLPTLIAAIDVIGNQDRLFYWEKAQSDCEIWATEGSMIYKDKAYFCEHAAAMDWLFYDGKHGWELEEGKNPFDKSDEEIADQAKNFCYRCCWCLDNVKRQKVSDKSWVSETNQKAMPKLDLVQLVTKKK